MINRLTNELVQYGTSKHLVEEDDRVYVTNRLLELFGQMEFSEEITEERPFMNFIRQIANWRQITIMSLVKEQIIFV